MLRYLNIVLDDSSASFCHYEPRREARLISLPHLQAGIRFAMLENLMVQFVYPDYELPAAYEQAIDTIDHFCIRHQAADADVCVVDNWDFSQANASVPIVLHTTLQELKARCRQLLDVLSQVERLNVVISDVDRLTDAQQTDYQAVLEQIADGLAALRADGKTPQLNILTDRLVLTQMNNCEAGVQHITLAPDGRFYVCPAFYYASAPDVGTVTDGLNLRNAQLYRLESAPICQHCDCWHCKRCIWQNYRSTLEVNTPSHEQCVASHTERNASRYLQQALIRGGQSFAPEHTIQEIDYLDPFDKRATWK